MKVAILAVGSELLSTERVDTNSLHLAAVLEERGARLVGKGVAGDREEEIGAQIEHWLGRSDLVLVTGGLGPTEDDRTRAAVASTLGLGLEENQGLVEELQARYAEYGRPMADVIRRQAEYLEGGRLLPNPVGSAPGWHLQHGDGDLFLFPGVPREMKALVEAELLPWLEAKLGVSGSGQPIERRTFKVACRPESEVESKLAPLYATLGRDRVAVLASPGEVRVVLSVRAKAQEREKVLLGAEEELRRCLGNWIFARGEVSLEEVVGDLLRERGQSLATAESCTGGLLAERLTRVPGSSEFFPGGVVSYSNRLKQALLGVEARDLDTYGAVSEPVAKAMATGAKRRLGADYGIGITGIAGPGGGSADKPVGTVHLALAGPGAGQLLHQRRRFPGDRNMVRQQSSQLALEMLRCEMISGMGKG